jgi:RNA polymerase sigma factor (sigma-70 family)
MRPNRTGDPTGTEGVIAVIGREVDADTPRSIAQAGASEFADLVEAHLPRMYHLAERLAGSSARDDVVQEALINAWRKRGQFDDARGSLASWLLAITADQARKSWRRRFVFVGQLERPEPASSDTEIDVEAAVSRLPGRQRLAVDCFYFGGLTVAETAAVMRCSQGTVKSTLSDARARLRTALESYR